MEFISENKVTKLDDVELRKLRLKKLAENEDKAKSAEVGGEAMDIEPQVVKGNGYAKTRVPRPKLQCFDTDEVVDVQGESHGTPAMSREDLRKKRLEAMKRKTQDSAP